MPSKILVLGGSFAGLTAAFDLKRQLGNAADITVISRQDQFIFIPSLIWVVPGWRKAEEISFDLEPALNAKGINFVLAVAEKIDPERNVVVAGNTEYSYDYLVIATGPHIDFKAVPGLGPKDGHTTSICTMPHAIEAQESWKQLLKDPGPVIIGATQGASCFGAAYEFVFNVDYALRKAGVRKKTPITFVTAEPFLGHFGIGGLGNGEKLTKMFFKWKGIEGITNAVIEKVTPGEVHLKGGQTLPYKYAMIIPPFLGAEVIRNSPGVGNDRGFIPTNGEYRHVKYPNIFAAGVAVAVNPPAPTPVPAGVPKTGYMSEVMAKVAAKNIVAEIKGGAKVEKPFPTIDALCILDAGNMGVIMITDRIFAPRKRQWLIPGPWGHWAKLAFEKYFLWKMRNGRVDLP